LIDEDVRIRNLARIFFSEMSQRDSGVYNHIPDILSNLSDSNTIDEESFRTIMKFIFEFIKKEKQMENLIEKLCSRFRNSDDLRHSRDLAYCLSLISFSGDRSLKKLAESFPLYQDKLVDEGVLGSFVDIINRSKKFCKSEMKALIDEFELRLLQASNRNNSESISKTFAALSQTLNKNSQQQRNNSSKANKKTKGRGGRRKQKDSDDEDDEDINEDYFDEYEAETVGKRGSKRSSNTRKSKSVNSKYVEVDTESEDDEPLEIELDQEQLDDQNNMNTDNNQNAKNIKKRSIQRKNRVVVSEEEDIF
jgi:hypothetical protein